MIIVNESGLYSLLFYMQPQKAKGVSQNDSLVNERIEKLHKFKRWVTSEVLPTIRKTGSYSTAAAAEMPNRKLTVDDYIRIASFIATCKNERLPYVLAFLRSGGIELPETPQAARSSARVERDTAGEAQNLMIEGSTILYGKVLPSISMPFPDWLLRRLSGRLFLLRVFAVLV